MPAGLSYLHIAPCQVKTISSLHAPCVHTHMASWQQVSQAAASSLRIGIGLQIIIVWGRLQMTTND